MQRRAGGDADQDAFLRAEESARRERIFARDRHDLIIDGRIEHLRHKARADALDLVRTGLSAGKDRTVGRLDRDDLHIRVLRLQVFPGAGDRAAGTDARDEDIHITVGVLPDLGTGGQLVRLRVGRVDELSRNEAVRDLTRQFFRSGDGALHALRSFGQDELRTVCLHELSALDAHRLRHGDDDPVASGRRDRRQTDARVAAGRLDDRAALFEQAFFFRIFDHLLRNTVFDAAGRVEVLQLGEQFRLEAFRLFDVGQFEDRGLPDEFGKGFINSHVLSPILYVESLCGRNRSFCDSSNLIILSCSPLRSGLSAAGLSTSLRSFHSHQTTTLFLIHILYHRFDI